MTDDGQLTPNSEIGDPNNKVTASSARQAGFTVLGLGVAGMLLWWVLRTFVHLNIVILVVIAGLGAGLVLAVTGDRLLK